MKWKRKRLLTVLNYPDFRVGAARTLHWKYHKIRRCLFPANFPQYMFVMGLMQVLVQFPGILVTLNTGSFTYVVYSVMTSVMTKILNQ